MVLKWFIGLYDRIGRQDNNLVIGSRVRTAIGRGIITSGSVSVKYDDDVKLPGNRHEKDRTVCHNLSKINFED